MDTNLRVDSIQKLPQQSHNISRNSILPKCANDRKPGETVKQWGSRLRKRIIYLSNKDHGQPKNLAECKSLYDELLQMDDEAYDYIEPIKQTKEEQDFFGEPEIEVESQVLQPIIEPIKTQVIDSPKAKKVPLETDQTNEKFERFSIITGDYEKNVVFREQNLGQALKR